MNETLSGHVLEILARIWIQHARQPVILELYETKLTEKDIKYLVGRMKSMATREHYS